MLSYRRLEHFNVAENPVAQALALMLSRAEAVEALGFADASYTYQRAVCIMIEGLQGNREVLDLMTTSEDTNDFLQTKLNRFLELGDYLLED